MKEDKLLCLNGDVVASERGERDDDLNWSIKVTRPIAVLLPPHDRRKPGVDHAERGRHVVEVVRLAPPERDVPQVLLHDLVEPREQEVQVRLLRRALRQALLG